MRCFLAKDAVLRRLETPAVYQKATDELYELDDDSYALLEKCSSESGNCVEDADFAGYCLKEKILTRDKVSGNRPPLKKSPIPSLRYLELQVTDKCNLRCRHCYIAEGGGSELPVPMIRDILGEFEEMQGLRVLITGGEPLLHSGFAELNAMLPQFSLRKILFTNGLMLKDKILGGLNVDEIQVSIDGLEKGHNALRGEGTFSRAIDSLRRGLERGFDVSVSTMVHAANLGDFDGMEKLFRSLGVKDWTVDVPCAAGRLAGNGDFQVAPDEGGKYLRYGYGGGLHGGASGFACGLHLMSVTADGRVSKCTFYADRPAGAIEEGLGECWKRITPLRLDDLKCDCEQREVCRGGCRYRAETFGDPLGKDLYRCALYDIIKKEGPHGAGPEPREKGGVSA
jgi:radical SAM protein with 4Fe4S-binding SPASM domain